MNIFYDLLDSKKVFLAFTLTVVSVVTLVCTTFAGYISRHFLRSILSDSLMSFQITCLPFHVGSRALRSFLTTSKVPPSMSITTLFHTKAFIFWSFSRVRNGLFNFLRTGAAGIGGGAPVIGGPGTGGPPIPGGMGGPPSGGGGSPIPGGLGAPPGTGGGGSPIPGGIGGPPGTGGGHMPGGFGGPPGTGGGGRPIPGGLGGPPGTGGGGNPVGKAGGFGPPPGAVGGGNPVGMAGSVGPPPGAGGGGNPVGKAGGFGPPPGAGGGGNPVGKARGFGPPPGAGGGGNPVFNGILGGAGKLDAGCDVGID